jgi:hypothetical protein
LVTVKITVLLSKVRLLKKLGPGTKNVLVLILTLFIRLE